MARLGRRAQDALLVGGLLVSVVLCTVAPPHPLFGVAALLLTLTLGVRLWRLTDPPLHGPETEASAGALTTPALVSMVAHEIRAPLASIRGAASLLEEYDGQLDRARRRDLLHVAIDASHQLARIVDDLLLVSRIAAGRLNVERAEVDLVTLVRDASRLELSRAVSVAAQDAVPNVWGDPLRVRQVTTNLLTNALAYATEGSIVIVTLVVDGDRVRVTTFNEGRGIAPEEQSKLFLPFADLRERRIDSTGLGLYIAKQLVEAMGGTIGFDTQPGRNATFWFELQIARQAAPRPLPVRV